MTLLPLVLSSSRYLTRTPYVYTIMGCLGYPKFKSSCLQVGGREDSNVYIKMKIKAAEQIGIKATHLKLAKSTTEHELLKKIRELNNNPDVHGIIVQMPLDTTETIDSHLVTNAVLPSKDVDGLNIVNEGKVSGATVENLHFPSFFL